jgi:zona occludens toxin
VIYLSTGANGAGKTLFSLYDCRQLQLKDLRPVYYVEGRFRPGDKLTQEFGWLPCKFEEWEKLPDGSIVFCDEVQEDLPRRPTNGVVPEHIKKLAQHRVRGFDFFMQTPHPANLDSFVTRIIGAPGWHRHFKRVAGAAPTSSELRWDAVNNQAEKHGSGKNAQISMRGFPKEVYSWYQSAEVHTGKWKIPKAAIYLVVALPVICVLFYAAFRMMYSKASNPALATGGTLSSSAPGASSGGERKPKTASEYVADYRPRIQGLMHTAPAYDKLTEPKRVPVPAACVTMPSKGCKCFTQDATPYPIDEALCKDFVAHGAFLAFQPEGERRDVMLQPMPRPATETALPSLSGPILIEGGPKSAGAATALAAALSPVPAAQPRVQPGSKWSFQAGG